MLIFGFHSRGVRNTTVTSTSAERYVMKIFCLIAVATALCLFARETLIKLSAFHNRSS